MAIYDPPEASRPHLYRIARSFGYAFEGLATIVRTQPNFWVHAVLAVLAVAVGLVLRISVVEFAVIALTIGFVLVTEAINTVVETLCDLVSPGFHPLVKRAKDVSAAAVLIAALVSIAVALLVFGPRLFALLH